MGFRDALEGEGSRRDSEFESIGLNLNPLGSILEQAESIRLFHYPLSISNRGRTPFGGWTADHFVTRSALILNKQGKIELN